MSHIVGFFRKAMLWPYTAVLSHKTMAFVTRAASSEYAIRPAMPPNIFARRFQFIFVLIECGTFMRPRKANASRPMPN